jgi:pimeloyl-ACP methyl ester carboxylesterase
MKKCFCSKCILPISNQTCTNLAALSLFIRTGYVQERVNIGSGPPGSKVRWFRSSSDEPRFLNTVTFDSKPDAPTLVMVHGYAASQGFFFRNFDALASRFRIIAVDQLG